MKEKTCKIIFGSDGLIGSELFKKIQSKHTFTVSRKKNNKKNHFFGDISNFNFIKKIKKKLKIKYTKYSIFYLCGHSRVKYNKYDIKNLSIKNIRKLTNILDIFRGPNVKIVLASSGSVYDPLKKKLNEESKVQPKNYYTSMKFFEENIALEYFRNFKTKIIIARIFSIYAKNAKNFFLSDAKKKLMSKKKKISFYGSGKQARDYLYIEDICEGLHILLNKGKFGEIYNICSGKFFYIKKILDKLNKKQKIPKNIFWNKINKFFENDFWYGSNHKIKKIGFLPKKIKLIDLCKY